MRIQTFMKTVAVVFGTGMLLAGCGTEATPLEETSTPDDTVHAMAPPTSCDRESDVGWCRITTDKVRCANGRYIYAYSTPDGWCIQYDACKNNGGPYICGL